MRKFLQEYVRNHGFDGDKTTRYFEAFVDLNGVGKQEALVYLVGRWWCGSGGCPTLVLTPEAGSYRVVAKISITRPPIRVLDSSSNGWRSIGVWVQGGGIQHGYEAELSFDGKTYPENPSVPPARRLTEKVAGEIVVPSSEGGINLYPALSDSQKTTGAHSQVPRPSFNCASAKTPTEKLVCRDADLASMDNAMAAAYRSTLQQLPKERVAVLRREQLEWFKKYANACDAIAADDERKRCIVQGLGSRIQQLQASAH